MRKNVIKHEAARRANSTRAARTACAHNSHLPGTCKACSRCLFLITARARSMARMEEESSAVLRQEAKDRLGGRKEKVPRHSLKRKKKPLPELGFPEAKEHVSERGRPLFVGWNNEDPEQGRQAPACTCAGEHRSADSPALLTMI